MIYSSAFFCFTWNTFYLNVSSLLQCLSFIFSEQFIFFLRITLNSYRSCFFCMNPCMVPRETMHNSIFTSFIKLWNRLGFYGIFLFHVELMNLNSQGCYKHVYYFVELRISLNFLRRITYSLQLSTNFAPCFNRMM